MGLPAKPLQPAVALRLQSKSAAPRATRPAAEVATRQARAAARRVAFAQMDLAASMAAVNLCSFRAAALKQEVEQRATAASARAAGALTRRARAAATAGGRVRAAAVRRATAAAAMKKSLQRKELRLAVAAGQRAARLMAASEGPTGTSRASIASVRRDMLDAMREAQAQALHLRALLAEAKHADVLMQRAARAHMSSIPFGTPAKLTVAGDVDVPVKQKVSPLRKPAEPPAIFLPRSRPDSPGRADVSVDRTAVSVDRVPVSVGRAFPTDAAFHAAEAATRDVAVVSALELAQMRARATAPDARHSCHSTDSLSEWQVV